MTMKSSRRHRLFWLSDWPRIPWRHHFVLGAVVFVLSFCGLYIINDMSVEHSLIISSVNAIAINLPYIPYSLRERKLLRKQNDR